MNLFPPSRAKGFTLIELLVVIAIIAMLSSIVLYALQDARGKARDARRYEDIQTIAKAIELYINANGYPPDLGNPACRTPGAVASSSCFAAYGGSPWGATLTSQLQPYLSRLPTDPCGLSCPGALTEADFRYGYLAPGAQSDPAATYSIYAKRFEARSGSFLIGYPSAFRP